MSLQFLSAKLFLSEIVTVVSAAAEAFLTHPPANLSDGTRAAVSTTLAALTSAVTDLQAAEQTTDWRSIASEVLIAAEHLIPIVFPLLGGWAGWLPLGLSIVKNFIASVPASSTHPQEPPHAMVAAGVTASASMMDRAKAEAATA